MRQFSAILLFKLTNSERTRLRNCKAIALPGLWWTLGVPVGVPVNAQPHRLEFAAPFMNERITTGRAPD